MARQNRQQTGAQTTSTNGTQTRSPRSADTKHHLNFTATLKEGESKVLASVKLDIDVDPEWAMNESRKHILGTIQDLVNKAQTNQHNPRC